jgi:hypothetical protein
VPTRLYRRHSSIELRRLALLVDLCLVQGEDLTKVVSDFAVACCEQLRHLRLRPNSVPSRTQVSSTRPLFT